MRIYPAYRPSEAVYTFGNFSASLRSHVDIVQYPDLRASVPVGATLDLRYDNVDDNVADEILACCNQCLSGFLPMRLQPQMLRGIRNKNLINAIVFPLGVEWHFAEIPNSEQVSLGISTVPSVRLITKLNHLPVFGGATAPELPPIGSGNGPG